MENENQESVSKTLDLDFDFILDNSLPRDPQSVAELDKVYQQLLEFAKDWTENTVGFEPSLDWLPLNSPLTQTNDEMAADFDPDVFLNLETIGANLNLNDTENMDPNSDPNNSDFVCRSPQSDDQSIDDPIPDPYLANNSNSQVLQSPAGDDCQDEDGDNIESMLREDIASVSQDNNSETNAVVVDVKEEVIPFDANVWRAAAVEERYLSHNKRGRKSMAELGYTIDEQMARIREQNRVSQQRRRDRKKLERLMARLGERVEGRRASDGRPVNALALTEPQIHLFRRAIEVGDYKLVDDHFEAMANRFRE